MACSVDSRREVIWGQRLRRFEKSRLTVAAFCRAEGISAPSFYHWRKRLAEQDGEADFTEGARESFVPVRLTTGPAVPGVASAVEIHLPNGVRVCVPSDDLAAVRAGIVAAGELGGVAAASGPTSPVREESPC